MKTIRNSFTAFETMRGCKQAIFAILICLGAGVGCKTCPPSEIAMIHAQKSSTLIEWLNETHLPNGYQPDPVFSSEICSELSARHQVDFLLGQLDASNSPDAREWLVSDVLRSINDRRIYKAFSERLSDKEDRDSYYIALYLAQRGNASALATLNRHYFQYPVASYEWEVAVAAFGKFRYMPAATNVYGDLNAGDLGLAGTACGALQEMFPDSPRKFVSPAEAEAYFGKRISGITNARATREEP
jgi:hypothetical protein